jgi:hypothetical protein
VSNLFATQILNEISRREIQKLRASELEEQNGMMGQILETNRLGEYA